MYVIADTPKSVQYTKQRGNASESNRSIVMLMRAQVQSVNIWLYLKPLVRIVRGRIKQVWPLSILSSVNAHTNDITVGVHR